jgi:HSP20 family molecular chaperone IbpA
MTVGDRSTFMWSEACALIERAERLHRQFFLPTLTGAHQAAWEPPVDIYETEREYCIVAALPGVEPRELEVSIEGDVVVIGGMRRLPSLARDAVIRRLEIPHGRFERRVPISADRVRLDRFELLSGCLVLILKKSSEAE